VFLEAELNPNKWQVLLFVLAARALPVAAVADVHSAVASSKKIRTGSTTRSTV